MKQLVYVLFPLIVFSISFSAMAQITEVFPNPVGVDNGQEFVEAIINVSNYSLLSICDLASCDDLSLETMVGELAVIIDESNNKSYNCTVFRTTGLIGNGLGNTADTVTIKYNNTPIDKFNYSGLEVLEGLSLQNYSGIWGSYEISPCQIPISQSLNITNQSVNNSLNITLNITTNQSEQNFTNTTGLNETEFNETECTYNLTITADKLIYEGGETIKFWPHLNDGEGAITYWVEDYFGNIRKKEVTSSTDSLRSYTPAKPDYSEVLILKAKYQSCELLQAQTPVIIAVEPKVTQDNAQDNEDSSENTLAESELSLKIEYLPENLCETKEIMVELHAARAENKRLVQIDAFQNGKRITQTNKLYLEAKNSKARIRFPLSLPKFECDGHPIEVIATGLDLEQDKIITYDASSLPDLETKDLSCSPCNYPNYIPSLNKIYTLSKKFKNEPIGIRIKLTEPGNISLLRNCEIVRQNGTKGTNTIIITPNSSNQNLWALFNNGSNQEFKQFTLNLSHDKSKDSSSDSDLRIVLPKNDSLNKSLKPTLITGKTISYASSSLKSSRYFLYVTLGLIGSGGILWQLRSR